MSDVFTNRSEQGRGKSPSGESTPQEPLRIRIDVPMGTSYQEIQESIFRQVYQLAGTQLRAAIALGITPDTISRVLRRQDRKRTVLPRVPEAWPVVAVNRALDGEMPAQRGAASAEPETPPFGPPESGENGPQEDGWASNPGHEQERKDDD